MLYYRMQILFLLHGNPIVLPDPIARQHEFLCCVYEKSLKELRQGPDWPWSSYTASLLCLRGLMVQVIYELLNRVRAVSTFVNPQRLYFIVQQIKATGKNENVARDFLRRLYAHIVLGSDEVPESLEVSDRRICIEGEYTLQEGRSQLSIPRKGEGSYADVYCASFMELKEIEIKQVALKRLRFQETGSSEERALCRQVCDQYLLI